MHFNDAANTITGIQILPMKPNNGLLGFAAFILNANFYVGNIAIHSRPNGEIRLVYPHKVLPNGKVIACFHPITRDAGDLVLQQVIEKYERIIEGGVNGIS